MAPTGRAFQGKLAIVTGASKPNGVGFAVALALAEQGADIVIHYYSNKTMALQCAEVIKELGVRVAAVQADASNTSFGKTIVDATLTAFPGRKIDILINNAGVVIPHATLAEVPAEEFDTHFHVNVRSVFLLIQAAERYLASPGGRIINVSSIAARQGLAPANFYSGSKAALHAMSRGWAQELGPRGITVNVAVLGPIETDLVFPEENPETQKFRVNQYLKRNGTTREAAEAFLFLASPGNSYVTGQALAIDGGLSYAG
ncbi:putative short-chain dehydrogenases/reductase [Thozetella sp. PMI_491]|nr:putative short-chain dehydrogenases/reductase [Thozetella sp. PMI_491]